MSTHALRHTLVLCLLGVATPGCGSGSEAPAGSGTAPDGNSPSTAGTSPFTDDSASRLDSGLPGAPPELVAIAATFAPACSTTYSGDETRAAFDPTQSGPHGLLFIAPDGSADPLNNAIPEAWRPHSAGDVQLVACVSTVSQASLEICKFVSGRTLTRQQRSVTTRVVSPRSGLSESFTTKGAEPPPCPGFSTTFDDLVGDLPTAQQMESDIVDRFVPVPDCGGSRPLASCLQCFRDSIEAGPSGCGGAENDATQQMKPTRTGQSVALDWQWSAATAGLFLPSAGFDWSASTDAALLTSLHDANTSFVPDTARSYSFLAKARMPDSDSGQIVQTTTYTIEARDLPVVQSVVGVTGDAYARVGQSSSFSFNITGRPDTGYFGETERWTWIERPDGSTAAEPTPQIGNAWSFVPDVAGTYRIQLEYSDGVGFSEPVTSPPITAITGPLVSGLVDKQVTVGVPQWLEGSVTEAIGFPSFQWTLSSWPNGSVMNANYFAGQTSYGFNFVADVAGAYVFDVVVTDQAGQSAPAHFTVTATASQ
jgi:hypothetical protein